MRFSKNKSVHETQNYFYFYLEKIVNIALSKTKRGENQSVKDIVDLLKDIFDKFWDLKHKNPLKFEQLFWSYDFYQAYVHEQNTNSGKHGLSKDASYRLAFTPERELKGITLFIKSYEKIWKCAFQYDNDEVSQYAVYSLSWILGKIACEPSNKLVIEQFLNVMNSITFEVAKTNKSEYNDSVYTAAIYWYLETIFGLDNNKNEKFDISYLELFNEIFFHSLQIAISNDQEPIFKKFVSSSYDGIFPLPDSDNDIWDYAFLGSKLPELIDDCASDAFISNIQYIACLENELYTKDDLKLYLQKISGISTMYSDISIQKIKTEPKLIESELIKNAKSSFKLNSFRSVVFNIASYCIFKRKIDYIKYLWDYKQPSGTRAIFAGHDILPDTIRTLFLIYNTSKSQDIHEDHHKIGFYREQYLFILLTKLHVHFNKDLELNISNLNTVYLENEYSLLDSIMHKCVQLLDTSDILINKSTEWESLLEFSKETKEEYQLEYEKVIVKISSKSQFEMTKKWLQEKIVKLEEMKKDIEKLLPICDNKISTAKTEILTVFQINERLSKMITITKVAEDSNLGFIHIGYYRFIQKHCFLKVSTIHCSRLWHDYAIGLANTEIDYFLEIILNENKIERIYCGNMSKSDNIYQSIIKAIESLKKCDFIPSTLLLHDDCFNQIQMETDNQDSPFYQKLTKYNCLIIENYIIRLVGINNYKSKKFNKIILLDKTVCLWSFQPSGEENERIHITVSENGTDKDEAYIEVETVVNLEIKNTFGIKIIEQASGEN